MIETGTRRGFLTGLLAAAAVPLITSPPLIRAASLMPVKLMVPSAHRWLEAYMIGTDEVVLRADFNYNPGLGFQVSPRHLVPSPETIRMAEKVLRRQLIEADDRARLLQCWTHVDYVLPADLFKTADGGYKYD